MEITVISQKNDDMITYYFLHCHELDVYLRLYYDIEDRSLPNGQYLLLRMINI